MKENPAGTSVLLLCEVLGNVSIKLTVCLSLWAGPSDLLPGEDWRCRRFLWHLSTCLCNQVLLKYAGMVVLDNAVNNAMVE